ncbi:MAG: lytic transglycosylase domain-containing protein [Chthoniobacterales bacterium]
MSVTRRILLTISLLLLALAGAAAWVLLSSGDPAYRLGELAAFGRYDAYNSEITAVAARHGVDPLLLKSIIWQESRFQPDKLGAHGERGLMQVTEPAAQDWVAAENIETFSPADLLDPKTNIEVGAWYLAQALRHWASQEDPLPFALGEYNAGRSRVKRWAGGLQMSADELNRAMDIPSTKAYVASVRGRYDYYRTPRAKAP